MKEYIFRRRILVQLWTNETFYIESENEKDAKETFLSAIKDGTELRYSDCDHEYLYDTTEEVKEELLDEDYNVIKKD